ncbi:uroporphyrinogen-III synthase [Sphingomonas sp. Mn802worker]|uniref:uroporphyrinogen-III synthase n=1 Tax=Sphingomonas sp. Mn802worker TaxID=629773 RepID=UPI0003A54422
MASLRGAGVEAVGVPLFAVRAMAWDVPDPARFDAVLLTSANAVRLAGAGLRRLSTLPVVVVGEATAAAARAAGLHVVVTGRNDAAAAIAAASAFPRLLHLAGREHVAVPGSERVIVYASDALPVAPDALAPAIDGVVLLHSARAALRFAALWGGSSRGSVMLAAISAKVAAAAGAGWARVAVAETPNDAAVIAAATKRAIDPARGREDNARHE